MNELIKITNINSLVISGGGTKGYLYIGAIKLLFKYGIIRRIKYFYGTSFGSLIISCLNLNWSLKEILQFAINFPTNCIIDYDIDNFINNYGLVPKENYEMLFKKIVTFKHFNENLTFRELYDITKKELHLMTFSLKQNKCIDINYQTYPNLKIWEGLYMSSALPLLIPPFKYGDDMFIDGGIGENFPINRVYDENKNKTIGICTDSYKINLPLLKQCNNQFDYLVEIFKIACMRTENNITDNCIKLFFDNSDITKLLDYSMTPNEKIKLINSGYKQSQSQIKHIIETIFKNQININKKHKIKNKSCSNEI